METAGKLVEEEQLKEALKERGLGTPATRASIIETLLDRGYITRDKKSLAATDLGRYLVAIVRNRSLKSPELTGDWEAKLRQVERGRLGPRRIHGGDRPVYGRGDPLGRPRHGGPRTARRLPPLRTSRDRGQAGIWLLRLARRLPLRPLARISGPAAHREPGSRVASAPRSGSVDDRRLRPGRPPSHRQRRSDGDPGPDRRPAAGRRGRGRPARRAPRDPTGSVSSSGLAPTEEHAPAEGRRDTPDLTPRSTSESPQIAPRPAEPTDGFASVALGPCPLCGSGVVEQAKSYGCSGWKQGCKFAIWKTIAGKAIGVRTAQSLLKSGRTPLLKGFRSKAGKPFEARLKLEGGEVRFDFG